MPWDIRQELHLNINAAFGSVLLTSATDSSLRQPPPDFVAGDKMPVRLYFWERGSNGSLTAADPGADSTLVFSGRPANIPPGTDLLFLSSTFTEVSTGVWEGELDLATAELAAHIAATPAGVKTIVGEVEVRDATGAVKRKSLQFPLTARPQVYENQDAPTQLPGPEDWLTNQLSARNIPPSSAVYPREAIGDGQSHAISERYATLAEAQAVWPHVTSLAQEIDWAALQAVLDSFNQVDGEEWGGVMMLEQGKHYRLGADPLVIRGPGVAILGENRYGTLVTSGRTNGPAITVAPARDETIQIAKHGGLPKCLLFQGWRLEYDFPAEAVTDDSIGFSSLPPSGNQGFWYFIYFVARDWDCHGFQDAVELANVPVIAFYDVSITGKTSSITTYKADSLTIINGDINGTWIPRQGVGQYNYNGSTNLRVLNVDETTFDGEEVVAAGGAGFFIKIVGGELGHSLRVVDAEGATISIDGSNIEDINGLEAFLLSGATSLNIENTRLEPGGEDGKECLFRLLCPTANSSAPHLKIRNCRVQGWTQIDTSSYPAIDTFPIIRLEGDQPQRCFVETDADYLIEVYNESLALTESIKRPGLYRSHRQLRVLTDTDESHSNEQQRGFLGWLPASSSVGEDLMAIVQQGGNDGRWYRTSMLNNRLMQVLAQSFAQISNNGSANEDMIYVPVHKNLFRANGDRVVIRAAGQFAANGNTKGVNLQAAFVSTAESLNGTTDTVEYTDTRGADYGGPFAIESATWNDVSWIMDVEIVARSSTELHYSSNLLVDGELPRVQQATLTFNDNAMRWIYLQTSGVAAGDVLVESFVGEYRKGISNV